MDNVGAIKYLATIDTSQYKQGSKQIQAENDSMAGSASETSKSSNASFGGIANIGLAAVATAAVAVGAIIIKNIGGAIKRVDTLNNSARTFENMGFATADVDKAMSALNKSILGLPTSLDSGVRGMTSLAATYGSVEKGQKIFSALNDAILGFGGTTDEVNNAILQLSQLPMDGPLDAQTWNSLRNSGLTPVLVAMAKDMGMGVNEMKTKFGEGTLTVKNFTDELAKMDINGGGGLKSLEKIAQDSTKGIGTGFANANTAVTRGLAGIIKAIGATSISDTITSIGAAFESSLKAIIPFVEFVVKYKDIFAPMAVGIGILIGALAAWGVATLVVSAAQAILSTVLSANPIGLIIIAIAALVGALVYFFTQTQTGQEIWKGFVGFLVDSWGVIVNVWNGAGAWFSAKFTEAVDGIKSAFSSIGSFFSGVWNTIVSIFTSVGTAVGNAIGNAVRSVVNSVLSGAVGIINGFIDALNGVIGLINKIPGVHLGGIGRLPVPQLADGGIVSTATLAMIGEGREPEAVIPLSKLDAMLSNRSKDSNGSNASININVSGVIVSSPQDQRKFAEVIGKRLNEVMTQKGFTPSLKGV